MYPAIDNESRLMALMETFLLTALLSFVFCPSMVYIDEVTGRDPKRVSGYSRVLNIEHEETKKKNIYIGYFTGNIREILTREICHFFVDACLFSTEWYLKV